MPSVRTSTLLFTEIMIAIAVSAIISGGGVYTNHVTMRQDMEHLTSTMEDLKEDMRSIKEDFYVPRSAAAGKGQPHTH